MPRLTQLAPPAHHRRSIQWFNRFRLTIGSKKVELLRLWRLCMHVDQRVAGESQN